RAFLKRPQSRDTPRSPRPVLSPTQRPRPMLRSSTASKQEGTEPVTMSVNACCGRDKGPSRRAFTGNPTWTHWRMQVIARSFIAEPRSGPSFALDDPIDRAVIIVGNQQRAVLGDKHIVGTPTILVVGANPTSSKLH